MGLLRTSVFPPYLSTHIYFGLSLSPTPPSISCHNRCTTASNYLTTNLHSYNYFLMNTKYPGILLYLPLHPNKKIKIKNTQYFKSLSILKKKQKQKQPKKTKKLLTYQTRTTYTLVISTTAAWMEPFQLTSCAPSYHRILYSHVPFFL